MKKIILIILISFWAEIVSAQRVPINKGYYLKSSYIDQFIGTWQWKAGNDIFTIKFKKVRFHHKELDLYQDMLFGWYSYVKDGKMIENSFPLMNKDTIGRAVASETKEHILLVNFTDMNTKTSKMVVMELIPGDKKKAIWRIDANYPQGISHESNGIPTGDKWIMEKIE